MSYAKILSKKGIIFHFFGYVKDRPNMVDRPNTNGEQSNFNFELPLPTSNLGRKDFLPKR